MVPATALMPFLLSWWREKYAPIIERRVAEERAQYGKLNKKARELIDELSRLTG